MDIRENSTMRIPKIAYFYWGGEILPYLRYLTLATFKKFNPDWNVVLYTPKKLQKEISWRSSEHKGVKIDTQDYFSWLDKLGIKRVVFDMEKIGLSNDLSEVHKSDFLRWHLLGTVGGIWSDMDIIYFRPIRELIQDVQILTCFQRGVWSIGLLGSSPKNSFYRELFDEAKKRTDSYRYQYIGCILFLQVHGRENAARKKFPQYRMRNIPMHTVYPIPARNVPQIYETRDINVIKDDTVGLHWYAGHKMSGMYTNLINHTNVKKYDNLLTWTIRRAGV